ncbi:MAG: hotdog domain-containing protein [Sulfolobaceae archaeon]
MKISETIVTTYKIVHYSDINFLGRMHGGVMLMGLVDAGMLSAMKVAKSLAVLASLDEVEFKKPVNLGDVIEYKAQVEYIGNSSMEVRIKAYKYNEEIVTATSSFVKVNELLKPIPINEKIEVENDEDKNILIEALERRRRREKLIADRHRKKLDTSDPTEGLRYRISTIVQVTPELTYNGKLMSAGKLLKIMDDIGGIIAHRYIGYPFLTKDNTVTVAISDTQFFTPARLGDILNIRAGIIYVGNTSLDVLINVIRQNSSSNEITHVTTSYFTYVRINENGKPTRLPEYKPQTDKEKFFYDLSLERRKKNYT